MTIKAKATVVGGRILIRTYVPSDGGWFDEAVNLCRSIPGGRFQRADKAWSYPLSVDVCHSARKAFGDGLTVMPALSEWYEAGVEAAKAQTTLANATDAELALLPTVAPALAAALRPDQRVGAAWVAAGHRGAGLVADQPGCGKTLVTIAGILEADLQGPILIACPRLSVKAVWWKELTKWTTERVYIARGTRQKRQRAIDRFMEDPADRKWLIIVGEMLRVKEALDDETDKKKFVGYEYPDLFQIPWTATVVDESHKMFGSLTVVKGNLAGKGLKRLPSPPACRRIAVTGTPFGKGGRVEGMFGTLHWLWPDEFTSFWRWAETHFVVEEEEVYIPGGRGRTRTTKRIGGLKNGIDEESFLHTLGPRILRRTKEEVLPWLPPKQHAIVWCEMNPAQVRQYKSLVDDGEVVTAGGMLTADGVLAEITRSKQLANGVVNVDLDGSVAFTDDSCKIDALMEKLETRGLLDGSGDGKVIVASQFNEFLKAVGFRLQKEGIGYHLMTGSTSDAKRDKMMAAFQEQGGHRVFMLNSKAGGVSVTLDAADEVHALDEMWDPGDNEQLEDRVHRASRNHQVTIYHYYTEGTIDEAIAEDVEGKRFEQFRTLDGRRGREYLRNLTEYRKPKEDNA